MPCAYSYRAYKGGWTGRPLTQPNVSVSSDSVNGLTVYVSWNGATNVSTWALMGASDGNSLASVTNATKTGFETAINTTSASNFNFVSVAALDAKVGV